MRSTASITMRAVLMILAFVLTVDARALRDPSSQEGILVSPAAALVAVLARGKELNTSDRSTVSALFFVGRVFLFGVHAHHRRCDLESNG